MLASRLTTLPLLSSDCTELFIEMPSSYKSNNTAKGLVGTAPSGSVTFISCLYGGHISDKNITQECGLISPLESGDMVMADRGLIYNTWLHQNE